MAKIIDDPKVQELLAKTKAKHEVALEKAVVKARKEALKEAMGVVKASIDANKDIEDKNTKKLVAGILRDNLASIRGL